MVSVNIAGVFLKRGVNGTAFVRVNAEPMPTCKRKKEAVIMAQDLKNNNLNNRYRTPRQKRLRELVTNFHRGDNNAIPELTRYGIKAYRGPSGGGRRCLSGCGHKPGNPVCSRRRGFNATVPLEE